MRIDDVTYNIHTLAQVDESLRKCRPEHRDRLLEARFLIEGADNDSDLKELTGSE